MDKREDVKSYYPGDCGKDKREDSGNYYPGGTVVPQGKVPSGQENFVQKQEGLEVKTNTIIDLREAVKELAKAMGATVVSAFAAMAAFSAEVQTAKLSEIELDTGSVVTNVVLDGVATTADLDGKRDKTDLNVYGEVADKTKPYLADDLFPIVCDFGGDTTTCSKDDVRLDDCWLGGWDLIDNTSGSGLAYFGADGVIVDGAEGTYGGKAMSRGSFPRLSFPTSIQPTGDTLVTSGEIGEVTGYARAVYNYMLGNTNAWFSGTNYPDHTSVAVKHRFQFEPGMDLLSVPCSMSLMEIRDGERGIVWDQRDWVSWYWSFKASQMRAEIAATNAAIIAAIPRKAWGGYTANGLDNPDPTTVWVDRENTTLAAGMAWQNAVLVNGCGYWTIVGRGISLSPDEKRTSLDIRDFDGKSVMRIIKGESYLAPVTQEDFIAQGVDSAGRITFTIRSNVKPVGEYSTVPDTASFVAEDSENCPADWEWEQIDGGWKIHFLLKSGIVSNACFARFKVSVEGQSTIEYTTAPTISGGLIYNGVKIAPVINGDTVTWKVVK